MDFCSNRDVITNYQLSPPPPPPPPPPLADMIFFP